jgi:hypothetical protein
VKGEGKGGWGERGEGRGGYESKMNYIREIKP